MKKQVNILILFLLLSTFAFSQEVAFVGGSPKVEDFSLNSTTKIVTFKLQNDTSRTLDLTPVLVAGSGTDNQTVTDLSLSGNTLSITLERGNTVTLDLTPILSGTADGSETKLTAGTNVTITGAGTTASPYLITATGTGGSTPIANNLTTTTTGSALDATQGKNLLDSINAASVVQSPLKITGNITVSTSNASRLTVLNDSTSTVEATIPAGFADGTTFMFAQRYTGGKLKPIAGAGVTFDSYRETDTKGEVLVYTHLGNDEYMTDSSKGLAYTPVVVAPPAPTNLYTNPDAASNLDINAAANWSRTLGTQMTVASVASDYAGDSYALEFTNGVAAEENKMKVRIADNLTVGNYTITFQYKIVSGYNWSIGSEGGTDGWQAFYSVTGMTNTPLNEWRTATMTGDIITVTGTNPKIRIANSIANAKMQIAKIVVVKNN